MGKSIKKRSDSRSVKNRQTITKNQKEKRIKIRSFDRNK